MRTKGSPTLTSIRRSSDRAGRGWRCAQVGHGARRRRSLGHQRHDAHAFGHRARGMQLVESRGAQSLPSRIVVGRGRGSVPGLPSTPAMHPIHPIRNI